MNAVTRYRGSLFCSRREPTQKLWKDHESARIDTEDEVHKSAGTVLIEIKKTFNILEGQKMRKNSTSIDSLNKNRVNKWVVS